MLIGERGEDDNVAANKGEVEKATEEFVAIASVVVVVGVQLAA